MLADRIRNALEVLGSDFTVQGTLREQASAYLGEEVDDNALAYLKSTAKIVYDDTLSRAKLGGYAEDVAELTALANVMIAGAAIGKRLGIEQGEDFARRIEDLG